MNQAFKQAVIEQLTTNAVINQATVKRIQSIALRSPAEHGVLRDLIESGLVPERDLANCVCQAHNIEAVSPDHFPQSSIEESESLARFFREHEAMPLSLQNGQLELAMTDPSNRFIIKIIESKLNCHVVPKVAIRSELIAHLNQLYPASPNDHATKLNDHINSGEERLSSTVREVHRLLQNAASKGASDVHFEPHSQGLQVRFRLNGLMQVMHKFSSDEAPKVVARLKLMAKLDVTEKRQPQNGRFQLPADGRLLDFRLSSLPLHNGESIVLRLLENSFGRAKLADLGLRDTLVTELEKVIESQQGLLLVTGPTGSGKTTTLYSLLSSINKPELKLISIEDPVELDIENINQIQVDEEHGIDFAEALRSVLRQDPDVIMVGEIRDEKTAQLAAQAALTGHLVLSTLHTSSAVSAIARLRNLGLADYLIDGSLKGIMAQRLLRTTCSNCAKDTPNNRCQDCSGSGYSGRTAIAEYLPFREYHTLKTPSNELHNHLLDTLTLKHQADQLVKRGVSTQQEVFRVLGNGE